MNAHTETTYCGYYAMRNDSPDLPVWVTARTYAEAETLLAVWRGRRSTVADALLSADPVRIECDRHALEVLDSLPAPVTRNAGMAAEYDREADRR